VVFGGVAERVALGIRAFRVDQFAEGTIGVFALERAVAIGQRDDMAGAVKQRVEIDRGIAPGFADEQQAARAAGSARGAADVDSPYISPLQRDHAAGEFLTLVDEVVSIVNEGGVLLLDD